MRRLLTALLLCVALLPVAVSSAGAQATIGFDDLPGNIGIVPDGYNGLNWVNMGYVKSSLTASGSGFRNGLVSPTNVGRSLLGVSAAFGSPTPFMLNSFSATAAWRNNLIFLVRGFLSGVLVHAALATIDTTGPTVFKLDWDNITGVIITTAGGTNPGLPNDGRQFAIDDMSINYAVPEGSSIAMLILGGLPVALGVIRKRRRA